MRRVRRPSRMILAAMLTARALRAALLSGVLVVFTLSGAPMAMAQSSRPPAPSSEPAPGRPSSKVDKAAASSAQALAKYRASLEPVQAMYERELARQTELAEMRMVEVGKQRPLGRGGYEETPGLVRFNGPAPWSLASDAPKLQRFFQARFGRPLPISAFGQSPLHDRMGFDHRNALDVALDPSSSDGRAFMEHLRTSGIPFIAAWGAIPGAASGAHIHVGQPSPRLVGRR